VHQVCSVRTRSVDAFKLIRECNVFFCRLIGNTFASQAHGSNNGTSFRLFQLVRLNRLTPVRREVHLAGTAISRDHPLLITRVETTHDRTQYEAHLDRAADADSRRVDKLMRYANALPGVQGEPPVVIVGIQARGLGGAAVSTR